MAKEGEEVKRGSTSQWIGVRISKLLVAWSIANTRETKGGARAAVTCAQYHRSRVPVPSSLGGRVREGLGDCSGCIDHGRLEGKVMLSIARSGGVAKGGRESIVCESGLDRASRQP